MLPSTERAVTGVGVSVGTALAMSTFFKDPIETPSLYNTFTNIENYDTIVFNLLTLIRNILEAFPTETRKALISNPIRLGFIEELPMSELYVLKNLFSGVKINVKIFIPSYRNINAPTLNSDIQKPTLANLEEQAVEYMVKRITSSEIPFDVITGTHLLRGVQGKVILFSHKTMDYLNINRVNGLTVLESYTGRLVPKREFNKYYNTFKGFDNNRLPFDEKVLFMLGGKNLRVRTSIKLKRELLKLAEEKRWTVLTRSVKIDADLNNSPFLKEAVKLIRRRY